MVAIGAGAPARSGDDGRWTITDAPFGTRMIEVRAVGHYPELRAIDIVEDTPPIHVELATMQSVLDTVRVTATRPDNAATSGFEERRRGGFGRYVTPADVARLQPIATSDVFRRVPGLYVDRDSLGGQTILMRSLGGEPGNERCSPAVYIDGRYVSGLTADDINLWVTPDEIAGIEVYPAAGTPAPFNTGVEGCGSIAIWTRLRPDVRSPSSKDERRSRRAMNALAVAAVGLLLGFFVAEIRR
jgi:hypothetical protein